MKPNNPSKLSDIDYMVWLRRYILVHSYLYYELGESIITDQQFDSKARELVTWQHYLGEDVGRYAEAFKGFNGSTGFDLCYKLNIYEYEIIKNIAHLVLNLKREEGK